MLTAFYRVPLWNFNFSLLINIFCDISPPFSFKFVRFSQYFPRKCINKDQLLMLENWDFKRKNLLKSEISFYPYKSKHYLISHIWNKGSTQSRQSKSNKAWWNHDNDFTNFAKCYIVLHCMVQLLILLCNYEIYYL